MATLRRVLSAAIVLLLSGSGTEAFASAPLVLHTAGYEAPVHGGPDDLLIISGDGFEPSDRVVYQAAGVGAPLGTHPREIPTGAGAVLGTADVVQMATTGRSLTVRLPSVLQSHGVYRLWVVNAADEWSAAMTINDARPMWITPSYVHETVDVAGLGRRIRVVGRNLAPDALGKTQIRLKGSRTYVLSTVDATDPIQDYVAEASLPARVVAGMYSVGVSRDGHNWIEVAGQRLEVRPDPASLPRYALDEPRFGGCHCDDGVDDGACLAQAIAQAAQQGGGVIVIPAGTWDFSAATGFVLPANVQLAGAARSSTIVSHDAGKARPGEALFTLTGHNSISGLTFTDTERYHSHDGSQPMIRLGTQPESPSGARHGPADPVRDIVISDNVFRRVGRAIGESDRRISRLFVTHNEFSAYDSAIELPGNRFNVDDPFRVDDSIFRWNHFVPGSYLDVQARQGAIASGLGASLRLDFSSNVADGASKDGLQDPDDPPGWRAAFFWNMNNNHELLLVAENRITCSGDKTGDGEAIGLDANGNTFGFNGAPSVSVATANTLTVRATLLGMQNGRSIERASYYRGHWLQVVEGAGLGQARKITGYTEDARTGQVVFRVSPAWDVIPSRESRVVVGRDYWQVYAVANEVDHRAPPCHKANLSGPSGGAIGIWAPSADSAIEGNRQYATNGILVSMAYSVKSPNCAYCDTGEALQTALEVRGNLIDGEYDWTSDCSRSGITAAFGASPTPESPPPAEGVGISISHNDIRRADGFRGGAIDVTATWFRGPPPSDWPLVRSIAIFANVMRDIGGPAPAATCKVGQRTRVAIRLDGTENVRNAVLSSNTCERVDSAIDAGGNHPLLLCSTAHENSCECRTR